MTDHFEIHERDGAARLGELRLAEPVTTPALVDDIVVDAGSLWTADRALPDGDGEGADTGDEGLGPPDADPRAGTDAALTILPHRAFPAGTRDEVTESFAVEHPDVDYPAAAVVASDAARDHGVDAYVLSDAGGVVGHATAFVDAVLSVKDALPADTALYLSGVATPRNVATLAYAGIDLFDAKRARVKGRQGKYLTTDDERFLADLDELPCACPACEGGIAEFDRADCADHNERALAAELRRVRRRIREGRLRDYVEGQARHDQWLTATLRELDQQWGYLEQRTPVIRDDELTAASAETLDRVEIQRFADRVTSRYRSRFTDHPLVLVPCSARKPYSDSQSHRQFRDAIQYRAHTVSMTSPIGVVPQELELTYPAQHYDAVVTGEWSEDEVSFVAAVLERYLQCNQYPRVIAHLPPHGYRDVVERATADLGIEVEFTVADHPTSTESLANLMSTLAGEAKYRKRERQVNTVRAVADYQFGVGAGDALFPDPTITGRYPKLQVRTDDGEQLAALVPQYGVLSLTLAGGRRWLDSDAQAKRVAIDDFVPHGSVLAPGVVDASDGIRVGDEVVIEGPSAFAVGRAQMSGPEMVESSRGVACEVRHVEET